MVTLIILDGCGIRKERFGNAIKASGMPYMHKLMKKYPHTELKASGEAVGLPEGQMGNSEVGHLTIGAGKIILQDLLRINKDVESGKFAKNKALIKALKHAENGRLHIMGIMSDGGVHAHINHTYAILDEAKKYNIKEIYIHFFTDGRDTFPTSGINFLNDMIKRLPQNGKIASICGRFLLDREMKWERVEKLYNFLTGGKPCGLSAVEAVENSYKNGIYDEFIEPQLIEKNGIIKDGDSVIFTDFRTDRAWEISRAIADKNFDKFKTKKFKNLLFTSMTEYCIELRDLNTLYPPIIVKDNLAAIISKNGLKQYHISETTKFAHVTFFLNGGIEKAYRGEDRKLIDTIKTSNYEYYPEMRAEEITTNLLDAIASGKYDFLVVNYSNLDMIGHTGNFNAAKEAATIVDKRAYAVTLATLMAGGEVIITADHGNAELMFDKKGRKITSHTNNLVPLILVSNKKKYKLKKHMGLSNIAPTLLELLNIPIPEEMDENLIKR